MAKKPTVFIGDYIEVYNPEPNQVDPRRYLDACNRTIISDDGRAPGNAPYTSYQAQMYKDGKVNALMRTKMKV